MKIELSVEEIATLRAALRDRYDTMWRWITELRRPLQGYDVNLSDTWRKWSDEAAALSKRIGDEAAHPAPEAQAEGEKPVAWKRHTFPPSLTDNKNIADEWAKRHKVSPLYLRPQPSASEAPSSDVRERMIDAALAAKVSGGGLTVSHFIIDADRHIIGSALDAAIAAQRKEGES